jgi:hypothetical protein
MKKALSSRGDPEALPRFWRSLKLKTESPLKLFTGIGSDPVSL